MGKVSLYFHAEWHGKWSEIPVPQVSTETKSEQADGGHYHGDVYHANHSPEAAQEEATKKADELEPAEADINMIEPL